MSTTRWTMWSISDTKYGVSHMTYKSIEIRDPKNGDVIDSLDTYGDCNDRELVLRMIKNNNMITPGSTLVHADSELGKTLRGGRW